MSDPVPTIASRTAAHFREHRDAVLGRTSRLIGRLILLEWIGAVALAWWISPSAWAALATDVHPVPTAFFLGGALGGVPLVLVLTRPIERRTRHVVAVCQALMSALLVHLTAGHPASHLLAAASLALLALYRDWRVLVAAAAVTLADHVVRGVLWPESIYGLAAPAPWHFLGHGVPLVLADAALIAACRQSAREMWVVAWQRASLERAEHEAARFRTLCAAAPIGLFEMDRDGRVGYVNPQWEEIGQLAARDTSGEGWFRIVHADDRATVLAVLAWSVAEGRAAESEHRLVLPTGESRWVQARTNPVVADDGRVRGYVGTVEDVTVRRCAEDALRRSVARLRRLFESDVVGVVTTDGDERVVEANEAFLRMVGHDADAVAAGRISLAAMARPRDPDVASWETELVCDDGTRIPVRVGRTRIDDAEDGSLWVVLDLTGEQPTSDTAGAAPPETIDDDQPAIDPGAVLARVAGDMDLLRELVRVFEQDTPARLAEIRSALSRRDSATLQQSAHRLKGALATLSAGPASAAAAVLEQLGRTGNLPEAADAYGALERELWRLAPTLAALVGSDVAEDDAPAA